MLALLCFQEVSLTEEKIKRKVYFKSHFSGSDYCVSKEEVK